MSDMREILSHFPARCIAATVFVWLCSSPLSAQTKIDFEKEIAPILQQHCLRCHSPGDEKGDISLATPSDLLSHGLLVPGDVAASHLVDLITGNNGETPEMPKEGEPLRSQEVELIRAWIMAGANWPDGFEITPKQTGDPTWWSLQPPQQVEVPETSEAPIFWQHNPIDAFIFQKLKEQGLEPSARADRRTLVRRVTFDLTGLPPDWSAVESFVNAPDEDDVALSRVVDRLLASPRYGERWAQHWLDVIRWAETVGFETNAPRPNAWHYRDWVIEALNSDKPYDQFIFEQIAGDTVNADAALGFLVAGPANLPGQIGRDEMAMRQARQDELDEVINTVSQAFLALTVGCARCHNHKFDPITQRDYYSMQAIFAGLSYGDRRLHGDENDAWTRQIPAVQSRLDEFLTERDKLRTEFSLRPELKDVQTEHFPSVLAQAVRMRIEATNNGGPASLYEFEISSTADSEGGAKNVALASEGAIPSASGFALENQTRHFDNLTDGTVDPRQAFPWVNDRTGPAWLQIKLPRPTVIDRITWYQGARTPTDYVIEVQMPDSDNWLEVAHTRDRMPRIDDTRSADQIHIADLSPESVAKIVSNRDQIRATQHELARLSAGPQTYAASFSDQPEPTWLLRRGDAMQRSEIVEPSIPGVLLTALRQSSASSPKSTNQREIDRRLALARHLTEPDHPLTARVIVNRVWQHHFGTGLVATSSDFGKMGALPSHPELLDWLAIDLIEHGWSLKHLHRLILSSQTYQQSSQPHSDALKIDADCRLLWRFPPRRLEAEAIRDSILAVSGKLNLTTGGPGFDFFNQRGGLSDYVSLQTFDESGWRRMIYAHKVRMQAIDIFSSFDCPDGGQMKPRRTQSITPLQSLSLLNSPFTTRQAEFFAERVRAEASHSPTEQIAKAFRLAYSRDPDAEELEYLRTMVDAHGLSQLCRVILNTSEFVSLR